MGSVPKTENGSTNWTQNISTKILRVFGDAHSNGGVKFGAMECPSPPPAQNFPQFRLWFEEYKAIYAIGDFRDALTKSGVKFGLGMVPRILPQEETTQISIYDSKSVKQYMHLGHTFSRSGKKIGGWGVNKNKRHLSVYLFFYFFFILHQAIGSRSIHTRTNFRSAHPSPRD